MVPKKKKVSLWFIILGAILSGYAGYLLNGAWEPGGDINSFLESFNNVCAAPFGNYYNVLFGKLYDAFNVTLNATVLR